MIAAHADQIGLQVTWVDEHGSVYFDKLGGVDPLLLPGRAVVIQGRDGAVDGVVGKRPTHLIPEAERGKAPEIGDQWIDIGAARPDAARRASPAATRSPSRPHSSSSAAASSPAAASTIAPACTSRRGRSSSTRPDPGAAALTALSTVQEETRCMGALVQARRQRPDCVIVVDADSRATSPRSTRGGSAARWVGGDPCSSGAGQQPGVLLPSARSRRARDPVQIKAFPGDTQTDKEGLQTAGEGTAGSPGPSHALHALPPRGRAPRRPRDVGAASGCVCAPSGRGLRAGLLHASGLARSRVASVFRPQKGSPPA